MSQETINLIIAGLIGFVPSLLILILNNLFQNKREERNRKWELEDRKADRRIKAKDSIRDEAQEYLHRYEEATQLLRNIEVALLFDTDAKKFDSSQFDKLRELTNFTSKRLLSVGYLDDLELMKLNDELRLLFNNEVNNAFALNEKILNNETFDKRATFDGIFHSSSSMSVLISRMQTKLEKLSQTIS